MDGKRLDGRPAAAGIVLLVLASVALTRDFACALPLAAFAAMAPLLFDLRASIIAVLAVWLTNQIIGFAFLHYRIDATTLAWGGVLGLLGLAALFSARATLARISGLVGSGVAFIAAFAAYEGPLFIVDVGAGLDPAVFLLPVVGRTSSRSRRRPSPHSWRPAASSGALDARRVGRRPSSAAPSRLLKKYPVSP